MCRIHPPIALLALALLVGAPRAPAAAFEHAPALETPLAFAPLDTPLSVTGGFGEYRIGHFHAGFDFGTGGRVGRPVRAPLTGRIERVRASGVGYGRSLYLRTTDGRLIQFGHLDAYMAPVAAWVDSIQRATGQYEQDLWPEPSRFSVRAGQRIAWTGQSGAGGPHLHFEIRRGDTALQPERAGLQIRDDSPPSLVNLTLEPLDDSSSVAGRTGPVTIKLAAAPETLRVLGRARAIVGSRDGVWRGVDRMVPWLTRLEWGAEWLECRMDSISWATDMSESDYVYDAGRIVGDKGMVLWAPAGWRPRFFATNMALDREAGTIRVRAGDPPRVLRLIVRDVSGNSSTREVVIVPFGERVAPRSATPPRDPGPPPGAPGDADLAALQNRLRAGEWGWTLPADATFEEVRLVAVSRGMARPEEAPGLIPVKPVGDILPASTPLRRAFTLHLPRTAAVQRERVGLYRSGGDGWELLSWSARSDGLGWDATSGRPGRFALFADTLAPRVTLRPAPRRAPKEADYSTWALEADVSEAGSGVNARGCYFLVDDRRVAVEWDPEAGRLRWRPLHPPAPGRHRVTLVAADRAGNARKSSTFITVQ